MDSDRRNVLIELFNGPRFKKDRAKLIAQSGYSKGRITQLFDESEPFGERAARTLAGRLGLDPGYFERSPAKIGTIEHEVADVDEAGQPTNSANVTSISAASDRITEAIGTIGGALAGMDPVRRAAAAGALHHLIENPRRWPEVADEVVRIANERPR